MLRHMTQLIIVWVLLIGMPLVLCATTIVIAQPETPAQKFPPEVVHCLRTELPPGNIGAGTPAFSSDGSRIAATFFHKTTAYLYIWDTKSGKLLFSTSRNTSGFGKPMFLSDNKSFLSANSDNTFSLWNLEANRQIATRGKRNAGINRGFALSADGRTLVSSSQAEDSKGSYHLTLWETASLSPRAELFDVTKRDGAGPILGIAPDGHTLALGHFNLYFFDDLFERTFKPVKDDDKKFTIIGCTFAADSGLCAIVGSRSMRDSKDGKYLKIYNSRTCELVHRIKLEELVTLGPLDVVYSPDSRYVSTISGGPEIRFWDPVKGALVCVLNWNDDSGAEGLACSANGKMLATTSRLNGYVLLWDLTRVEKLKGLEAPKRDTAEIPLVEKEALTKEEAVQLWRDLADKDTRKAFTAVQKLALYPQSSITLFREQLKPALPPVKDLLDKAKTWIADLDAEEFPKRQQAERELKPIAYEVAPQLRAAFATSTSAEQKKTLKQLIDDLDEPVTDGNRLRPIRAIEVLEHIGSTEAMDILRELSKGHADAWQTKDAKLALERLTRRQAALAPRK